MFRKKYNYSGMDDASVSRNPAPSKSTGVSVTLGDVSAGGDFVLNVVHMPDSNATHGESRQRSVGNSISDIFSGLGLSDAAGASEISASPLLPSPVTPPSACAKSTLSVNRRPPAAPAKVDLDRESKLKAYSKSTQEYINRFDKKPKNSDIVRDLKLAAEEEEKIFKKYYDPVSLDVMNIPVRVANGEVYDLQSIIDVPSDAEGIRLTPLSQEEFYLRDLQPARDIDNAIKEAIQEIQKQRQISAGAVLSTYPDINNTIKKSTHQVQKQQQKQISAGVALSTYSDINNNGCHVVAAPGGPKNN